MAWAVFKGMVAAAVLIAICLACAGAGFAPPT